LRGYGHGPTWRVEIDPPGRFVGTYYEETCKAAEMIWSLKQGPLHVLYSGGMDSEYVISVFRSLGMKVTPVIMRMKSNTGSYYNNHDLKYAFKYCQNNSLSYQIVDLNFDNFVKSGEMLDIANSCQCARYEGVAPLWLAKQINGTVITGNDPPLVLGMPYGYCLEELEVIHSQLTYWKSNNIHGTPFFLSYTSDMMLSFLQDIAIQEFVKKPIDYLVKDRALLAIDTNTVKSRVFNNQDKFIIEPRQKYTGYEYIENSRISAHANITLANQNRSKWEGACYYNYHTLIDRLSQLTYD
jgi:hypothetical protein